MPDEIPHFDDWIKTQDPNRQALSNPRVKSFLDKIGKSEGADYNTLVGGSRINDLSRHPNKVGLRTSAGPSTAFGKYQIVGTTDRSKLRKYRDLDYSPENQDLRAVELLRQTGALEALERGDEATAIKRAGREWASIPGSPLPGRKNTAAFRQQRPAKPSEVPRFDDWVATQEQPTEQSPAPRGRLSAMAEATPVVRRPRVQTGQVEDSGLGPQFPKGTTRGAATSRNASLVGQQRTPRISGADFNRADRDAVRDMTRPMGTSNPESVDPRLLKGEQPSDPMAYAKAQELVGRVEPIREVGGIRSGATAMGPRDRGIVERIADTVKDYAPGIRSLDTPMGIKTDPIRGALSLGMVDARRTISPEEKLVDPDAEAKAETAYQVGAFAPAVVPYAAAGKVIGKIPALNAATREAHIARSALTFSGVELGRELARSAQTGEPLNPQEVAISTAIGGGIGGIAGVNPGLKKQLVAFITPGVVADVARGTDPETATFNALTNLAFGLHSYKGAPREVQNAAKVAVEPLQRGQQRGELQNEAVNARGRGEVIPPNARGLAQESRQTGDVQPMVLPPAGTANAPVLRGGISQQATAEAPRGVAREAEINEANVARRGAAESASVPQEPRPVGTRDLERRIPDNASDIVSPEVQTPKHYELQPRRVRGAAAGQFKKETRAQAEERRNQVSPIKPDIPPAELSPRRPSSAPSVETPTSPALKREAMPVEKREPSVTSARQAMTAKDRADLDLPELPPAERKSWQKTLEEAKAKGSHNASVLADEVLAKPRSLSDVETGQLVLRASELKTIHAERMKEIEAATDPDVIQAKRNQAEALENEFNKLTSATKASGTETGRALAARKLTINQDFDLISVLQRAKASKGRELNAKEREKFEGMAKRVTELETKLSEAQEAIKTRTIQREIDRVKRQTTRTINRRALDDEFADLRAAFATAKIETRKGVQASGLAGLDPEGKLTVLMVRMARNRVRAGVNDAAEVVDTVYEAVREHVEGLTKREVRDAISGYGLTKDRRSDIEREIARLRNEMKRISREEDVEAGVLSPRREGPRRSDALKLPMAGPRRSDARAVPIQGPRRSEARQSGEPLQGPRRSDALRLPAEGPRRSDAMKLPAAGPRLSEGVGPAAGPSLGPTQGPRRSDANRLPAEGPKITDAPFVGPRKNTIRQRIQEQIKEYERKLRERDYTEEPAKPRPIYDRQTSNLKAELEGLKRQVDAEIRGNDSRLETILAMRKAGMLTGLRTHMRNVGGTGAFQAFEEVSRIPGSVADLLVSTVTKQRALGAPNPVDVAKSSYAAATKGLREASQIMKYGATAEEMVKLERPRELKSGSKIIDRYVNTVFRTLGAEDKIFRTYAYERSILEQKRLLKTDKVTPEMEAQGLLDAEIATFNSANKAAEGVEWVRRHTGPVGSTAIDLVLPFRRTPANIASRLLESTPLGLGRGALQLFKAALNKKMSFEDQRKFSQTIGRSVTGSSLLLLGYWMAQNGLATGLSESDAGDREVQKASGRSPLAIRIGDNWHQVGSFSPIGNLLAVGAALHREQTRPLKEGEERGNLATAAMPVAARVMMDQPFLKGTSGALEAIESPYRKGEAFVGQTIGSFVPTAVADIASLEDNKRRSAKTIPERVQARVPVLRRTLPEDMDVFARPLQSRRTAVFDPTLTSRNSDEPFIQELLRLDVGVPKSNKKSGESDDRFRARQTQQGREMAKLLAQTVSSREYQRVGDADKIEMLKNVIEQTRKAVNAGSNPAGQERRRPRREVQVPTQLRRELRQIERTRQ